MEVYLTYKLSDKKIKEFIDKGLKTKDAIEGYMKANVDMAYLRDEAFRKDFENYIKVDVIEEENKTIDLASELWKYLTMKRTEDVENVLKTHGYITAMNEVSDEIKADREISTAVDHNPNKKRYTADEVRAACLNAIKFYKESLLKDIVRKRRHAAIFGHKFDK